MESRQFTCAPLPHRPARRTFRHLQIADFTCFRLTLAFPLAYTRLSRRSKDSRGVLPRKDSLDLWRFIVENAALAGTLIRDWGLEIGRTLRGSLVFRLRQGFLLLRCDFCFCC